MRPRGAEEVRPNVWLDRRLRHTDITWVTRLSNPPLAWWETEAQDDFLRHLL